MPPAGRAPKIGSCDDIFCFVDCAAGEVRHVAVDVVDVVDPVFDVWFFPSARTLQWIPSTLTLLLCLCLSMVGGCTDRFDFVVVLLLFSLFVLFSLCCLCCLFRFVCFGLFVLFLY